MSFLPGMFPGGAAAAGGPIPSLVYLTSNGSEADTTHYSFTSVSLGDADATRYIIVGGEASGFGGQIDAVTVAGVSATQVDASASRQSLWIAAVPTGTSGTITFTTSGTFGNTLGLTYGAWAAYDLTSATAYDVQEATDSSSAPNVSLDVPANGIIVGFTNTQGTIGGGGGTFTWTGALTASDENFDGMLQSNTRTGGAGVQEAAAATGASITATYSVGSTFVYLVAASWK